MVRTADALRELAYRPGSPWFEVLAVLGVFIPVLALVAALRLARPRSPWARRRYRPGSERLARSERRFPEGRRNRWDPLVDLFAGRTTGD